MKFNKGDKCMVYDLWSHKYHVGKVVGVKRDAYTVQYRSKDKVHGLMTTFEKDVPKGWVKTKDWVDKMRKKHGGTYWST